MKSAFWVIVGLAAVAALAWHFWPAIAPYVERAKGIEPVKVREMRPMDR